MQSLDFEYVSNKKQIPKRKKIDDSDDDSQGDPIEDSDDDLIREIENSERSIDDEKGIDSVFKHKSKEERNQIKNDVMQIERAFDITINESKVEIERLRRNIRTLQNDIFRYERLKKNQIEGIKQKYQKSNDEHRNGDIVDGYKLQTNINCRLVREEKEISATYKVNLNQFYFGEKGSNSCNPIAVVCSCYFLTQNKLPEEFDWHSILKRGSQVWNSWRLNNYDRTDFTYCGIIFNMPEFDEIRKKVVDAADIGGYLVENNEVDGVSFVTLESMIKRYDEMYDHDFAIVLTLDDYTYTILYHSKTDKWYFYDSHSSPDGTENASTLIRFDDKKYVCEHILKKFVSPISGIMGSPTYRKVIYSASSFIRIENKKTVL
jgi:hypothetical protein